MGNSSKLLITGMYASLFFFATHIAQARQHENACLIGQSSQGQRIEPVIIHGMPALKFVSRTGEVAVAAFQKYNGENGFIFSVTDWDTVTMYTGGLFISQTRVVFESPKDAKRNFNVSLREVQKMKEQDNLSGQNFLVIKINGREKRFAINFNPVPSSRTGLLGAHQKPVFEFIECLFSDFAVSEKKFQLLVANVAKDNSQEPVGTSSGLSDTKNSFGIQSKYDRFKDVTTVTLQSIVSKPENSEYERLGPTFSIIAGYQFVGQTQLEIPQNVVFSYQVYIFEGDKTRYRDLFNYSEEFIILADKERLIGTMKRTELRDNIGGKYEVMTTSLALEVFAKIVNSKRVEMRVGTREFELKANHFQDLRELLNRAKLQTK